MSAFSIHAFPTVLEQALLEFGFQSNKRAHSDNIMGLNSLLTLIAFTIISIHYGECFYAADPQTVQGN